MTNREDADRVLMGDAVISELRQFERLLKLEPALTPDQIAERMVWKVRDVKWLLKKMGDVR